MSTNNGNTQALQEDPARRKLSTIKRFLDNDTFRKQLASLAGQFMKPEDMIRLVMVATSRSPELLNCTPESILRCLMDAAVLKIRPGGVMGRGYLVPRRNKKLGGAMEACFDPGWRGLIDIARRSGEIKSIRAHVVYSNEKCHVQFGTDEKIDHEPILDGGDRGEPMFAYAVAEFKDGSTQQEVVSKADLDRIRRVSAAGNGGPWGEWWDEMARKSAVRRLCKYLPYSDDLDRAAHLATKVEAGDIGDFAPEPSVVDTEGATVEPTALPPSTAKDALRAQLDAAAAARSGA